MHGATLPEIDSTGSIIFLGSGFSQGAKNILGRTLPAGDGLRDEFAVRLKVEPTAYDLRILADELSSQSDFNLYQFLYDTFTVKELLPYQREILRLPWLRIYTTNYDDAAELAYLQNNVRAPSYSFTDAKPKKLAARSIVHLHGVIRNATEENVLDEVVLNEQAYVRQHLEKSPWYDDFERDLRFCSACFFLGYSLADHHISALLMKNPSLKEKTFFITRAPDRIFSNRVGSYGMIVPIGIEKFSELCTSAAGPKEASSDLHGLKAFRYLDPFMDRKTLAPPTALEVLNLVTYGSFNYQRCLSTLPRAEYIAPRRALVEQAALQLKLSKCLLVHSRLGNGKSIFLHILAHRLSEEGFRCFWCRPNPLVLPQDVELLKSTSKSAIFFDSYNDAIETVELLSELPQETKFIVAVRTGVQEVRLHEIQQRLPAPLGRLNLNSISKDDANDFRNLLDRTGLREPDLDGVINRARDFREIVVALYDNHQIKQKIKTELGPLLGQQASRRVFVATHMLKWTGQNVDPAFLRSVTGSDAYAEIAKFREVAGDIFSLDDDKVQVRSPMFSEYLIQHHLTTPDIVNSVHSIIVEAVKRKAERRYQAVLSSLMRFSTLNQALIRDPNRFGSLIELFERMRRDVDVNGEPLFWLQYSILMTAADDLPAAENFIRTAYERAASSSGFQTFQIDTYALRVLLLSEQRNAEAASVERFDEIVEKLERVRSMIGEESNRMHAVQVLEAIEPFVSARIGALSTAERSALVYYFNLLLDDMSRFSVDDRVRTGSDNVRAGVSRAKAQLLQHSPR